MAQNSEKIKPENGTPVDPLTVQDDDHDVETYYEQKKEQAETLWLKPETKQKAIDILNEELDQPYMPIKYLELFSDLVQTWESELKIAKMKDMTISKLLSEAVQTGKLEPEVFAFLMDGDPDQMLIPANQDLMQIYLQNGNDNVAKIFALDVMGQHAIDHHFTFRNTHSGAETTVNPVFFTTEFQTKNQNDAILKVNELTFKDASLNKFSIDLLLQIFIYYFPEFPFESIDDLAHCVVDNVQVMLGAKQPEENYSKTAELVDQVLESLRDSEVNHH